MLIYHYLNIAPWEEKHIVIVPEAKNLVTDNIDTHLANWNNLIDALEALIGLSVEIRIRSIVDIHQGKIGPFLKWLLKHPLASEIIKGFEGESLALLIARYPKESLQYELRLAKFEGRSNGRPSKAHIISQRKALEALRDNPSGEMAARALNVSYTLLYLIAKGRRGIPMSIEELNELDLEKWIPHKGNHVRAKNSLASEIAKV